MKHLKKFEEISFSNLFKRKKDKENEDKLSVPSEIKTKLELKGYTNIGYDEYHNIIANHPKKGNGILITNDIIESEDLKFYIDKEPYDKSQFGQNKHKVYLFKDDDKVYYLGDIRKFKDGKSLSYLKLDDIKPVNIDISLSKIYKIQYMRDLNKEEKEILDEELDRNVIERDLMADEITYREKLKQL
jgi:hypothetical protein